jgi:hypothetical protein
MKAKHITLALIVVAAIVITVEHGWKVAAFFLIFLSLFWVFASIEYSLDTALFFRLGAAAALIGVFAYFGQYFALTLAIICGLFVGLVRMLARRRPEDPN